jgi:drug/metabolite transporter (DMT)-like permease
MPGSPPPARTGFLLALAATAGWSMNFLFSRWLADAIPPFTLCFARTLVATALFAPFALRGFIREWPALRARWVFHAVLSLSGLGLFNALIYCAGRTTTVVNMALLAACSPVFTLILARFLQGENLTRRRVAGIGAAIFGIILLTLHGDLAVLFSLRGNAGDLFMLAGAFIFAFYTVQMRAASAAVSNDTLVLSMFLFSLAGLLPFTVWETASGMPLVWSAKVTAGILYLGAVASVFCYWCWTRAIASIGPGNAALIYYTIPLFSGLEAVLILDETLRWFHFAGGGLIIAGVVIATRNGGAKDGKTAAAS